MSDPGEIREPDLRDESQLRAVLREACEVPPVPESLLRRMDRNVEAVWGGSPKLHRAHVGPLRRAWFGACDRVSVEKLRAWSLTAAATIACLTTFLFATRDRYSWAEMLDRLQQTAVIRVTEEGTGREYFASAAEDVVAARTVTGAHVVDFGRRVEFDYRPGVDVLVQSPLGGARHTLESGALEPGAGLLWLLLYGDRQPTGEIPSVVVERDFWDRVQHDGREYIELRTWLACGTQPERVLVLSLLEPDSHFPLSVEVRMPEGTTRRLSIDRVAAGQTVLAVAGVPQGLPVVESSAVDVAGAPAVASSVDSSLRVEANSPLAGAGTASSGTAGTPEPRGDVVTGSLNLAWSAVKPVSLSAEEVAKEVDRKLRETWTAAGVTAAPRAGYSELMRRLYLDLTGRIPTVSEVRDFEELGTEREAADKLIEQLLASADHASHIASTWRDFLLPEEAEFDSSGDKASFEEWFSERLMQHAPYDEIVRDMLLAEGRLAESGPLLFYSAAKLEPEKLASRTARVFLGMRLECAQCHDDPFEPWTQNDFWSFAAYFARISRPRGRLEMASPVMLVRDVDWGDVKLPESDTVVAPRLLDGTGVGDAASEPPRRRQLAQWLTSRDNPFFARATVNRVWSLMFGRGIVDPVDGFGAVNQPVVPEVLDLLAGYFIASDFDLRSLYRAIAKTAAYQASSGGDDGDNERLRLFAQMHVKVLSAGQLYDSIAVASLLANSFDEQRGGLSLARIGNQTRQQFVQQFESPTADATSYQGGIPLALTMMNGSLIEGATGIENSGLLSSLRAPFFGRDQRVEAIFLATIARRPTASEWEMCRSHLQQRSGGSDESEGLADILWALLNSAEFTVNH